MEYPTSNSLKSVVENKWLDTTIDDSFQKQADTLVKKLFHPESYEQYRINVEKESKGVDTDQ